MPALLLLLFNSPLTAGSSVRRTVLATTGLASSSRSIGSTSHNVYDEDETDFMEGVNQKEMGAVGPNSVGGLILTSRSILEKFVKHNIDFRQILKQGGVAELALSGGSLSRSMAV